MPAKVRQDQTKENHSGQVPDAGALGFGYPNFRLVEEDIVRPKKETVWFVSVAIVLALALSTQEAASTPAENRPTARAALDKVMAKAKAWHPDAVLIEIGADADDKGTADNWRYTFRSASAKKRLYIEIDEGVLNTQEGDLALATYGDARDALGKADDPRDPMALKPLAATFVDSSQAITEASNNGLARGNNRYTMDLSDMHREGINESLCWVIGDNGGSIFTVSAKSGKLLAKFPQ